MAAVGKASVVLRYGRRCASQPSNKANGMTYDADLNLLVCEHATSFVVRFRCDYTREVLCSHFEGRKLNSPNDIVAEKLAASTLPTPPLAT